MAWGFWWVAWMARGMGIGMGGLKGWWWWLGLVGELEDVVMGRGVVDLALRPERSAVVIAMPAPLAVRAARWRPRIGPLLRQRDCLVPVTHSR